jgi:hypothetical protein
MPVKLTERFVKQYLKLPHIIQKKVDKTLILLDTNFRLPGLRSHPVEGAPGIFEAYVDQKYRVTFERTGEVLIIRNVDIHDDCLRSP